MNNIEIKARAKINLALDVCRRLENGYHEVKMIMQMVDIYDELRYQKRSDSQITLKVDSQDDLGDITNNLIYKAAKLMQDTYGIECGVDIYLNKNIPVAAGMAGGSTDAAAMLYGMNKIFDLGLSMQELKDRGVKIGADVPYCLMRGTALAEGIGEKLKSLPPMIKCPVLIAKPQISVSTKFVYENLRLDENTVHPDIDALIQDIKDKDLHEVCNHMGNVLETVTIPNYPIIDEIKKKMMNSGAIGAMMSGSGPTVFGLFEDEETAKKAYKEMKKSELAKQVYLTDIYNNRIK